MKKLLSLVVVCLMMMSCEKTASLMGNLSVETKEVSTSEATFVIRSSQLSTLKYKVTLDKKKIAADTLDSTPEIQEITVKGLDPDTEYTLTVSGSDVENNLVVKEVKFKTKEYTAVKYAKRVVVHKFTGTWCHNCPDMTDALDKLKKENDCFDVIAVHGGGPDLLKTKHTEVLETKFMITGYPNAVFDYDKHLKVSGGASVGLKAKLESALEKHPATSGLAIETQIEGNQLKVKVTSSFSEGGEYKLCCALLEDNIELPGTDGSRDGKYHHVLRTFATPEMGEEIGELGAGETNEKEYTFSLNSKWKAENLTVIAYTIKKAENGLFYINNTNQTKAGASVMPKIL